VSKLPLLARNLTLHRNLCLKKAFPTVKSKIKNQNVNSQIKIQREPLPGKKPADVPVDRSMDFPVNMANC